MLLAAPGCRDRGGDTEAGPSLPYEELFDARVEAMCSVFVRCGFAENAELCAEGMTYQLLPTLYLDPIVANGTVQYDGEAAFACIDAIREASCDGSLARFFPDFHDDACKQIFTGTLADQESCAHAVQCMSGECEDVQCELGCCEGTCVPAPLTAELGEPCADVDCVDDAYCSSETEVCEARKAEGEACSGDQCQSPSLGCDDGVCTPPPGDGQPCTSYCAFPYGCERDTDLCRPMKTVGEPCDPSRSICAIGLTCDGDTNTCVAPGGVGTACEGLLIGRNCEPGLYCAWDAEQADRFCQPERADGAECTNDIECQSMHCSESGTCGPKPVCI